MSSFIKSIGLANRGQILFRTTIQRLSAHQKYQYSSLLLAGKQDRVDKTDIRVRSKTLSSIVINQSQARNIFSETALGIWKLDRSREKRSELIGDGRERFFARISGLIEAGDYDSIIEEDFINLVALSENEQHLKLLENISMHYGTAKSWNYPAGIWGPQVMRLYYKMNQVDRAYNNIKDERFGTLFNQATSFLIALTMMYNSGRYNHVHEIYEIYRDKLSSPLGLQNASLVLFAAYAKENTPESFEKAVKLFDSLNELFMASDNMIKMRAISLIAYLAGNQGKPAIALNVACRSKKQNHIFLKNIKLLNLVRMERYDDMVGILRRSIEVIKPGAQLLLKDVHQLIVEKLADLDDGQSKNNLMGLVSEIEQKGLVSTDALETSIFREIVGSNQSPERPMGFDQGHQRSLRDERSQLNHKNTRQTYQRDRGQTKSYFEDDEDADGFEGTVHRGNRNFR